MENTQLEFGGLRSSIVVDGSEVPQYGIQRDEGSKEVTSWIVSEPDKHFAVHAEVINRKPGENYAVRVYLDGHQVSGRIFKVNHVAVLHAVSMRVSPTETRKFMFGSLDLSDDDALLEAAPLKDLGEIKILFHKVGALVPVSSHANFAPPPQAQKVHERSKKGLVHSVKYGATQLEPLKTNENYLKCVNETLLASHVIRYRPLAMLQANGIVPYVSTGNGQNTSKSPSPAPGPLSSKNTKKRRISKEPDVKPDISVSDDDEDDEDIVKKENELREQLARLEKKKTRRHGAGRPAKRVKQEAVKPFLPGEIIDLTI